MSVAEGSNSQTNGTCTSCFNWGTSARAYNSANSNVCADIISKNPIDDCKIYDPRYTDIVSTTSPDVNSCSKCEKNFYNVWEEYDGGNMEAQCSHTEGRGCTGKIDKCEQTICYSHYSNGTMYSSQLCHICKPGYIPAEVDIWEKGAKSCVKGDIPDNCKYMASLGIRTSGAYCTGCKKGFALDGNLNISNANNILKASNDCVGFTSDDNCMRANTTGDGCIMCWNAYYFSGALCTLASQICIIGVFAFLGLIACIN